jgi:phospholipase C
MDRRDFLRAGALFGGAMALGACTPAIGWPDGPPRKRHKSILNGLARESGIDTVVILMMENRSFDSYLGYLARDDRYIERGLRKYGPTFHVDGNIHQSFPDANGTYVQTQRRVKSGDPNPWRACDHPDPGHGWDKARAERDGGFLAPGSGNDVFALSYFLGADLPLYKHLARRFAICDHHHASVLGPTYPNREYLLSAQSGGNKSNNLASGGFAWTTIVDRLVAAGVSVGDFASDLPPLALFGGRMVPYIHSVDEYHERAAAGTLPQVTFVDPSLIGPTRTDDHPHGDPRAAQAFVRDTFRAFVQSPQWEKGLFILTYDEWGGFFDHVAPPILPDDRASSVDADNFGQAGFRVPTFICSPRSLPNYVDHRLYDHTSILRFLEWRFLDATAEGPNVKQGGAPWWLTMRDRYAKNIGQSLASDVFNPDPGFDLDVAIDPPEPPCATGDSVDDPATRNFGATDATGAATAPSTPAELTPFEEAYNSGYFESVGAPVFNQ